jgi:CubicO group peptidase (beta-lactamase class C family)
MFFSRPSLFSGAAACATTLGLLSAQVATSPQAVIQHIQDGLVPAVLMKGQPVQTTKLADRMAALHVPGVSIAVIHNGHMEWARGFGVAKIGGASVTADTLFQAASISKPVTALAALRLVEQGKLDLDADVNRYLKTWKVPDNEFTAKTMVTLRELLTHTAGMTVHGFPGYAAGAPVPTLVEVLNGTKPANSAAIRVDTTPGTMWRYAGGGYVIVQQLLMDVTGEPFPKLMQELVLAPIGMTRSTYQQPLPAARLSEAATPYRPNGEPVTGGPHTYPEMAPAGLWTTPSDLALYAMEVQKALAGKSHVLSAAMARQMVTAGMNQWGLGLQTGGSKEHPYFTHSGANEGFRCDLVAYQNGDGAAIMTNSDAGGELAADILRTIAYQYKWPDFQPSEQTVTSADPKVLDGYVGAYQLAPSAILTVTRDGDQMYLQLTGQPKFEIFPKGDREFFLKVVDAQLTFDVGPDGKATELTLHQNGDHTAARMNDDGAKRAAELQAAADKKFKDQTQDPRTEAVLKRLVEELRRGQPDYSQMATALADLTRQQLPQIQSALQQLGALQSLTFKGVGQGGLDIYEAKFENGGLEFRILLEPDGKIAAVGLQPQ